ncbi:MAG: hypothetical protein J2P21_31155 [Chloracidobacterium sp.]|nr:hypothetical protein [Chloracidobacterium sp.]
MNCLDFETIVIEIARERLMDAAARERGLEHIRRCSFCATLLAEERALSRDLRVLSDEGADEEIPDRIETALLAAYRNRAVAPESAVVTVNRRRPLAVAALALLTLGFGLARWMASSAPRESPLRGSADVAVKATPTVATATEKTPEKLMWPSPPVVSDRPPDRSSSSPKSEKRGRRSAEVSTKSSSPNDITSHEFVTPFFPVTPGGELIPLDSGQIVRVRMPRSSLISVGIPFNQERVNETIKADVLLSDDGRARAIRLVY